MGDLGHGIAPIGVRVRIGFGVVAVISLIEMHYAAAQLPPDVHFHLIVRPMVFRQ
jgi:diadenosine tetraphosphate (Ap4A) HIT family hydrolase